MATDSDKSKIVKALLKRRADVNLSDNKGCTPLHKYFEKIAQLIIKHKPDINKKDSDGNTALHLAIKSRNIEIIRMLLGANADMHVENNHSETPLNMITLSQDVD